MVYVYKMEVDKPCSKQRGIMDGFPESYGYAVCVCSTIYQLITLTGASLPSGSDQRVRNQT